MENVNSNVNYDDIYDVFLSYRREGGEAMAILLREKLTAKGYKVFLDIENLNSGSFNTRLLDVIDNCKDVVLVCSSGSLERCNNDGDWVRAEIAHAFKNKKNIVPFMLRGFAFPEVLPPDVEPLRMQNGINASSNEYFSAAIDRLTEKFLISKPTLPIKPQTSTASKSRKPFYITLGVVAAIAAAFALFLFTRNLPKKVTDKSYVYEIAFGTLTGSYTGAWKDSMPNGEGVFTVGEPYEGIGGWYWNKGDTISGTFVDGLLNGRGEEKGGDYLYVGEYRNGLYNGRGRIDYPDGSFYEGEFKNGSFDGLGKMSYADGTVFDGTWEGGDFLGEGEKVINKPFAFAVGSELLDGVYTGIWKDGAPNGKGKFASDDGVEYEGSWERGEFVYGTAAFWGGDVYVWDNGQLIVNNE